MIKFRKRVSKIWIRLSSIYSSLPLPPLSNDRFLINLLTGRNYLSAFNKRFSRCPTDWKAQTTELAWFPRSHYTQSQCTANFCISHKWDMLAHIAWLWPVNDIYSSFFWSLFAKCNRSWNRVSVKWKSRSYSLLIRQVLSFTCLSVEKKPWTNAAAVSNFWNWLWFLIDFRFADTRMVLISGFLGSIFLIRSLINLHLTLQSLLNRKLTRGCSSETSIFWPQMKPT